MLCNDARFPAEVADLRLGDLLNLILVLGTVQTKGGLNRSLGQFRRADLNCCKEITCLASYILSHWPNNLFALLNSVQPDHDDESGQACVASAFGTFYAHLYNQFLYSNFTDKNFSFLRNAFEKFIFAHWRGSQKRIGKCYKSLPAKDIEWFAQDDAREASGIAHPERLVRNGQVEGYVVHISKQRTECWINRNSLMAWCRKQDEYMPRMDVARTLGISYKCVMSLSEAGVLHCVASQRDKRHHFMRSDVTALNEMFSRLTVPTVDQWDGAKLVTLKEAMATLLGGSEHISSAFRAIQEGRLVPVARSTRHAGIAGYLFARNQIRVNRYVIGAGSGSEQAVNGTDVSRLLGITDAHLRGIVADKLLRPIQELHMRFRREWLFRLSDVRDIQKRYVLSNEVADQLGVSRKVLINHLRRCGMARYAVPSGPNGYRWKLIDRRIANSIVCRKSGRRGSLTIARTA